MNRRGFLTSIIALGAAPAIVRADSLMRVVPMDVDVFGYRGWNERWDWSQYYDDGQVVYDYGQVFKNPRSTIDGYVVAIHTDQMVDLQNAIRYEYLPA